MKVTEEHLYHCYVFGTEDCSWTLDIIGEHHRIFNFYFPTRKEKEKEDAFAWVDDGTLEKAYFGCWTTFSETGVFAKGKVMLVNPETGKALYVVEGPKGNIIEKGMKKCSLKEMTRFEESLI